MNATGLFAKKARNIPEQANTTNTLKREPTAALGATPRFSHRRGNLTHIAVGQVLIKRSKMESLQKKEISRMAWFARRFYAVSVVATLDTSLTTDQQKRGYAIASIA